MSQRIKTFLFFIVAIILQVANSLPVETQQTTIQIKNNSSITACWSVNGRKSAPCYFVELEITNPEMIAA